MSNISIQRYVKVQINFLKHFFVCKQYFLLLYVFFK